MNNFMTPEDFTTAPYVQSYAEGVRRKLTSLVELVDQVVPEYFIEKRRSQENNYVFVPKERLHAKQNKNLLTIWIKKSRIHVYVVPDFDDRDVCFPECIHALKTRLKAKYDELRAMYSPHGTAVLLEEAQHELTSKDYWNRQLEEPNLVWREIEQRRGQAEFRKTLLTAYGGKCAVTGCDLEEALEAAHIDRYSESYSNDPRNGLLLRADIHTLFDCFLIAVHPENYRIECADKLQECHDYRPLVGREIHRPEKRSYWPSKEFLTHHYEKFLDQEL